MHSNVALSSCNESISLVEPFPIVSLFSSYVFCSSPLVGFNQESERCIKFGSWLIVLNEMKEFAIICKYTLIIIIEEKCISICIMMMAFIQFRFKNLHVHLVNKLGIQFIWVLFGITDTSFKNVLWLLSNNQIECESPWNHNNLIQIWLIPSIFFPFVYPKNVKESQSMRIRHFWHIFHNLWCALLSISMFYRRKRWRKRFSHNRASHM